MRIISFDPRYRDDMIFLVLQAKDALGCVPRLNEDLLDVSANYLQQGDGFFLALSDDDRVIGCIGVQINGESARLRRFYVKANAKRQGIGSQLLATAEQFARAHGAKEAVVHMGDPAHYWESALFYPKHGYETAEYRWMKKNLDPQNQR
ncbi:MAG: GNAT family N-acetyltransferase [Clostridia bacterium]|nr:GNAT family N-acetyltransferase [Clostridia bacterium]